MKKMLKIVLVSILSFSGIISASALNVNKGDIFSISQGSVIEREGYCGGCYFANGESYNNLRAIDYKVSIDGKDYLAFCLDTNKKAAKNVKVSAILESGESDKFYAGIYAISAEISKNINNYGSGSQNFEAAELALRMFRIATGNSKKSSKSGGAADRRMAYIAALAAETMTESDVLASAKKVTDTKCETASCFYNDIKTNLVTGFNSYKSAKSVVLKTIPKYDKAKNLFKIGLNAAAAGNSATTSSATSSIVKSKSVPTVPANPTSGDTFVQKDYFDLTTKNFNSENVIKDLKLTYGTLPDNTTVNITRYSLNNGTSFVNGAPSAAVLKSLSGNSKIIIEVTTTTKRAGYSCQDIVYKLEYKYTAAESDTKVILFTPTGGNAQDFAAIYQDYTSTIPSGDPKDVSRDTGNVVVNFCDDGKCKFQDPTTMTDEEKEDCCGDWSDECMSSPDSTYCEYFDEYCMACDTEITVPDVCTYSETGAEGEMVIQNKSGDIFGGKDDDGNLNIKACLLNRKRDDANNSYQALSNSYCQVYCKEDFKFDFPEAVSVNSGTYFQLEAKVKATKTCYTSEIDTAKYKNDVKFLDSNTQEYKDKTAEYNACLNYENNYECLNPKIEVSYEETYNSKLTQTDRVMAETKRELKEKNVKYCNGDINADYSCNGTYVTTPNDGTKYVMSNVTYELKYKTNNVFYQSWPSGTVSLNPDELKNPQLINGLPISFNTEAGSYSYNLKLKDIGEYYNESTPGNCKLGRLVGGEDGEGKNSVYKTQAEKNATGSSIIPVHSYSCYYNVNCPNCDFGCEGDLCEIEMCDGPDCEAICIGNGCAITKEHGLSYAYRTVTLNNLNPTKRKLGYNWDKDKSAKAEAAIEEIQDAGEDAYNDASYVITLTPALTSTLKEYNKGQLGVGGYANETLECNDQGQCTSTFLRDLANGTLGNASSLITMPSADEKFTTWEESKYCQINTCTTGKGIGPAYK